MKEKLELLQKWCISNSTYEKDWYLEMWFNRGFGEEIKIEWACGLKQGYGRDNLLQQHNFFGENLEEAVDKAIQFTRKL